MPIGTVFSAFFLVLSITLSGCAMLTEGFKGVAGVSTKILEDERPQAISQVVAVEQQAAFDKTLEILKEKGAYVYSRNRAKGLIAVYLSETETTPVGIFFTPLPDGKTKLEVSSPSSFGKESIAKKLFSEFNNPAGTEKEAGNKLK
jgi:hypothetical protein